MGFITGASLSGNERNHLFLSNKGEQFYDLAGVSGLDHPGDSRSFAMLDFDRDGWQDIALINGNTPLLQLFRNEIGERELSRKNGNILAVRFVGSNHSAKPQTGKTNRDGYGAKVFIKLKNFSLLREHQLGEGYAAQNSAAIIAGIGAHKMAERLEVRWPSGIKTAIPNVPANMMLTAYEDSTQSPTGQAFVVSPYLVRRNPTVYNHQENGKQKLPRLALNRGASETSSSRLIIYTTMATWCASCKKELPQLAHLRAQFDPQTVQLFGVPVDTTEGQGKLKKYVAKYQPAYQLLMDLSPEQVAGVKHHVEQKLVLDALPATIITDSEGYILQTMWGVPSVSQIRRLLIDKEGLIY